MKNIIVSFVIIIILAVAGYFGWRYISLNQGQGDGTEIVSPGVNSTDEGKVLAPPALPN